MRRLIKDIALSMAISGGLLAICMGIINAITNGIGWAIVFVPVLLIPLIGFLFIGPVLVVVAGGIKGRLGYVLGPIMLFVLAPALAFAHLAISTAVAHRQEFWDIQAPLAAPQTVILENELTYFPEHESTSCRRACIALLAQRNDTVIAIDDRTAVERLLYVKMTGASCQLGPVGAESRKNQKKNKLNNDTFRGPAEFLALGLTDTCWMANSVGAVPDGIIIRFRQTRLRQAGDIALGAFDGEVYELIESQNGKEKVLGRRINGKISTPVPDILLLLSDLLGIRLQEERIGSAETKAEFYRDALGVDIKPKVLRGKQLAISLETIRQIVELSGKYSGGAMGVFRDLVTKAESTERQVTFPSIRRLMMQKDWKVYQQGTSLLRTYHNRDKKAEKVEIDQLLRSQNPDDVIFGLMRLRLHEYHRLAHGYQPIIERSLNSSDPNIVFAALVALGNKSPTDRAFALPRAKKIAAAQENEEEFLSNPLKEVLGTTPK